MSRHPAWKEFEEIRQAEEKRIRKLSNPAERARQFAHFDKWCVEETENINMLIDNQEAIVADRYEELKYV